MSNEYKLELKWGKDKNYIIICDGIMRLKCKPFGAFNLGTYNGDDEIQDSIENFSLLYFHIYKKLRQVSMILEHKKSGFKARIEPIIKKDDIQVFIEFRNIMDKYGVFEGRSKMDCLYGKDSSLQIEKNKEIGEKDRFFEEIKKLPGHEIWGTKKEVNHLRTMLLTDEKVLSIASGIMDNNTWLIACTSKRIIFVDCGMLYGVKHAEIMINKINSVSFKNGIMFGEIHVEDGSKCRVIKNVNKNSTKPFVDSVHAAMEMNENNQRKNYNQDKNSTADEILKFKQLMDMGVITKEEFESQKKKLLS